MFFVDVVGRYTMAGDLDLEADVPGLHEFAAHLRAVEFFRSLKLSVPASASPSPYDAFLTAILIQHTDGPVNIQHNLSELSINGSQFFMDELADYIDWLATNACVHTTHIHVEYYPGLGYLDPLSSPLVVSVGKTNAFGKRTRR